MTYSIREEEDSYDYVYQFHIVINSKHFSVFGLHFSSRERGFEETFQSVIMFKNQFLTNGLKDYKTTVLFANLTRRKKKTINCKNQITFTLQVSPGALI